MDDVVKRIRWDDLCIAEHSYFLLAPDLLSCSIPFNEIDVLLLLTISCHKKYQVLLHHHPSPPLSSQASSLSFLCPVSCYKLSLSNLICSCQSLNANHVAWEICMPWHFHGDASLYDVPPSLPIHLSCQDRIWIHHVLLYTPSSFICLGVFLVYEVADFIYTTWSCVPSIYSYIIRL